MKQGRERKQNRSKSGFTLLEIIVVVAMIVVIGSAATITVGYYIKRSREASEIMRLRNEELHKILEESEGSDIYLARNTLPSG
ncbi:MAG: prepilin-type N-terminal cleavage/methylation domain-containing protein [Saccharofermentanaceae bacterium]|mgnify:CR=1 FL=1|jgi:prepilin-type N-terminal cleavage/methylation domain-containing protein|nr:prepilin-type N-terminal cleavage/methylation domain-containing protein [Clostridia bacterium]NLX68341.1 prepilin-type N-terminal cleavage/methylation domain-containing protein [Clostridiaceae bacterium]HOO48696.1 prepilin-type N-terminal cleavage/methylation domain-containing protein [Saccharofermentans sp.]HPE27712.1 prepilin-type N-terminal cleavage/methylation domain-containing protein [Saccharofermentans sp.]HPG63830.1 prepilin-type N-terminal cleavage/methylation domain-containing prot